MRGFKSVILEVVFTVSLWAISEGRGVDLGLCSDSNAVCKCGSGSGAINIAVPIKECTWFYRWEPYCKPCQEYELTALCSQFQHCLTCVAQRTGGCSTCPVGRYGANCQGVCQCQNSGVCNPQTGECRCTSGYSGTRCEHRELTTCDRPPTIRNGQAAGATGGSSVSEGSVVTYSCNEGYVLVGPQRKRCESSGQWSGGTPRCEYSCSIPARSSNLQVNVENYRTMTTGDNPNGVELVRRVRFTCTEGYSLQGLSELNCLPTSQWNGDIPSCSRSCGQPPNLHNGRYEGTTWTDGGRVHYYCNDRFIISGDTSMVCRNGQWTGNAPSCAESANCPAPTIQNGSLRPSRNTYTPGTQITVQCAAGYVLDGAASITCENTGQWDVLTTRCTVEAITAPPVSCPAPEAPENGAMQLAQGSDAIFLPGERVEFTCNEGYLTAGSTERICQADATWSGRAARCIRVITCGDPGTPANAIREIRQPRFGGSRLGGRGRARIPGYIRTNSRTSGRDGSDGDVVDIDLPVDRFRVFTRVSYDCESRFYRLVGSQHRTCQNSGEWSGRQPTCIPICGKSEGARAPVIINGEVSRLGEWPWQASIAHRRQGNQFYGVCGGTVVSENWIVTAAHCVTNRSTTAIMPLSNIKIYLGKYYRDFDLDDESVQEFEVTEIHVHPNYDPEVLDSDMALVRLSQPATLTDRVSPVCLPGSNSAGIETADRLVQSGSIITVTGWGETENRTDAARLMMARLGTISNTECEDKYAETGLPLIVTSNMFCAGHDDGRSDTCFGDSGGPAIAFTGSGEDRQWYLVGVVSWGSPIDCGIAMQYSGFTKVSRFLSFINQFTGL